MTTEQKYSRVTPEHHFGASEQRLLLAVESGKAEERRALREAGSQIKEKSQALGLKKIFYVGALNSEQVDELLSPSGASLDTVYIGAEGSLDRWRELFASIDPNLSLLILNQVLERLIDPRGMLRWLRGFAKKNPSCVITIIAASKTGDSSCYRGWENQELVALFQDAGFEIEEWDPDSRLFQIKFSEDKYREFLASLNLPVMGEHLLITTELPEVVNGNIGRYVREKWHALGEKQLVLYLPPKNSPESESRARQWGYLVPRQILDRVSSYAKDLPIPQLGINPSEIAQVVGQLLFLYDSIRTVEYQDHLGIGCRIAQMKRAGLISSDIVTRVVAHGSLPFREMVRQSWGTLEEQVVADYERVSIEESDEVLFPSEIIRGVYQRLGYRPKGKISVGFPFVWNADFKIENSYSSVDTIIYPARCGTRKGDLLVTSLLRQCRDKGVAIKRLFVFGKEAHEVIQDSELLEKLESKTILGSDETACLLSEGKRAVCLLPYPIEPVPYVVLDSINHACPVLSHETGLPFVDENYFLKGAPVNGEVSYWLAFTGLSPEDRFNIVRRVKDECLRRESSEVHLKSCPSPLTIQTSEPGSLATVVVPVYRTPLNYVKELISGLNEQRSLPKEVIFVDDGSPKDYSASLQALVAQSCLVPHRLVSLTQNVGLAGARNAGLRLTKTKYLINLDSDDIPLNHFVVDLVNYLENHEEAWTAHSAREFFEDGEEWNRTDPARKRYLGLGSGQVTAQTRNILSHPNGIYRMKVLERIGGWDASSKAHFEDWQLFLRIIGQGGSIGVIPSVGSLYRRNPHSMVKTYSQFEAQLRLSDPEVSFSPYDASRFQAHVRAMRGKIRQLEAVVAQKEAELRELKEKDGA